jgi:hypothetical protein
VLSWKLLCLVLLDLLDENGRNDNAIKAIHGQQMKNSCSFANKCQSLLSLNLFSNKHHSADEQMKREGIATPIYIIIFILSLIVALLFAGPFSDEMQTKSIDKPTSGVVNRLHLRNISTLSCHCSTAAVRHSKILSLTPQYHSICSSDYVKPYYWIDLFQKENQTSIAF